MMSAQVTVVTRGSPRAGARSPKLEKIASDIVPLKRKITSLFSKILWFNLASDEANQK